MRLFIKGTDAFSGAFAECLCGSPNLYQVTLLLSFFHFVAHEVILSPVIVLFYAHEISILQCFFSMLLYKFWLNKPSLEWYQALFQLTCDTIIFWVCNIRYAEYFSWAASLGVSLNQGGGRKPWNSINFVCAHDGFTLVDLVTYNNKHNLANGEANNDGESHNNSWNCGQVDTYIHVNYNCCIWISWMLGITLVW